MTDRERELTRSAIGIGEVFDVIATKPARRWMVRAAQQFVRVSAGPLPLDPIDYAHLCWAAYRYHQCVLGYDADEEPEVLPDMAFWFKLHHYDEKAVELDRATEAQDPGFFLRKEIWKQRHQALLEKWPVLD